MDFKSFNYYTLICAFLSLSLGAVVIFGWYSGNEALIQVNPLFAPMQYNTALGFCLAGFGLGILVLQQHIIARVCGLIVALLGAATLSQYIFGINLGLDQIMMDQSIMTKTSHPGRMAPNTALCFTLVGLALLWGGQRRSIIISLAMAILALSLMALLGYLVAEESIYGWGNLTRMAIHTAAGFAVLASGLIFYGLRKRKRRGFDLWELMPLSVATVIVVITFFAWYSVEEAVTERNKEYFNTLVLNANGELRDRYNLYEKSLWGGLGLFHASKSVEREEWKNYVHALDVEKQLPGINGIGYINYVSSDDLPAYLKATRADDAPDFTIHPQTTYSDKFIIKFIEPVEDNKSAVGLDIGFEANRRAAAERARDLGVSALTQKITLVQDNEKQAGFLLLIPHYASKTVPISLEEKRKNFKGWVYAPFIGSRFLQNLVHSNTNQVNFQVYDGDKSHPDALIYQSAEAHADNLFHKKTRIQLAGRMWTILWQSNENFDPPSSPKLALITLVFGLFFAVFLYFALTRLVRSKETIAHEVERQTIELNKTRQQLELILNSAGEGIFGLDLDGHTTFINDAAESILGYSIDEMLDKSQHELVHHHYPDGTVYPQEACNIYAAFREGRTHTEDQEVFWHKNGHPVPVEYTSTPIYDEYDDISGAVVMFRDISERLEQQERLDFLKNILIYSSEAKTQDEFLEIVLKTICQYIGWPIGHAFIWDHDTHILRPSCCWYIKDEDTYTDFRNVTEETFLKSGIGLSGRVYDSKKPLWIHDIAQDSNFPRNKRLKDIHLHSGFALPIFLNGQVRIVLEFFSPHFISEDSELLRLWEAVGNQLSRFIERNEAEETRALYMAELEVAKEDALHANLMKSEFLANMSHEIRTPLNGVIGSADLLKKTTISVKQKKYLDVVINSGETLLSLINDVLDLSKIEAGEIEINPEPVSLRRMMVDIVSVFIPKAESKNIELKIDYEGRVPGLISADFVRINQIMTNLIGNSLKFVKDGHIAVCVQEKGIEGDQVTLNISVEDTGIGIPADKLDMIFEKFSQADAGTTKQYGGTGLGLAITQRLVDLMDGEIGVESVLGEGTTFWFEITVPVIEQNIDTHQVKSEIVYNETDPMKLDASILLVENEMVNQMVATDMLECMGCSVDLAENGIEALEKLKDNAGKYDVILMDCMMPLMDGYEATREIRKLEEGSDRHDIVIAMTANAMADEKDKCFEVGMDDYISKPVKELTLYTKLREYIPVKED